MTINAASRLLRIFPRTDGTLQSKYPDGEPADPPWSFEGLSAGLTGLSTVTSAAGSVAWDASGFARITYNSGGVTAIRYNLSAGVTEITVQFDIRRHGLATSKQLKIPSRGLNVAPYTKYSNVTAIGQAYSGNNIRIVYSDDSDGGDSDVHYDMTGTRRGADALTRAAPTFATKQVSEVTQSTNGTTWETYKLYWKPNTDNTQDGEFAIWKNGTLILHATGVWNCATSTGDGTNPGASVADLPLYQDRLYVALGEYANAGGFYEDYRNLKVGYFRPGDLP